MLALICWRITLLLTDEDGPWDIFYKLRLEMSDKRWSPLNCFYCTSVWVALPLGLLTDNALFYWLPISAVSILINLIHEKLE